MASVILLAACAIALELAVISQSASAPSGATQSHAPAGLEEEIKRVYEAAPDISPFSSKFDYALANPDQRILGADELAGWNLFRGKAKCNTCHLDGTESLAGKTARKIAPGDVGSKAPLFTDFTSSNIGVPRNPAIPYYNGNKPDRYGYIANPAGSAYVDKGVGDFLRNLSLNPNSDWARLAHQFDGKFQVSTSTTPAINSLVARMERREKR